jgi:hypothetical protein
MKTTLIALLSIFLLAFTCTSDKKEQVENDVKNIDEIVEKQLSANDFTNKLGELLTLEMAAEITGLPASDAKISPSEEDKIKYKKFMKKEMPQIDICYKWKNSGRETTMEVMGREITAPINNSISLSWVKNQTLEGFKKENQKPTEAQQNQANQAIADKANQLNANEGTKKAAKDMANSAMRNFSSEEVPNVGDCAFFTNTKFAGVPNRDLKVFYKGISFQINVNVSDDKTVNDAKAIKAANRIINEKLK